MKGQFKEATVELVKRIAIVFAAAGMMFAQESKQEPAPVVSIVGYLRDSGCVHRFPEFVKPAPNGCVESCVRAGSPLVLLTKDSQIYHPISAEIPDADVRGKMLPFVGKLVKITGTFTREAAPGRFHSSGLKSKKIDARRDSGYFDASSSSFVKSGSKELALLHLED
jgi:hypothetical protein